MRKVRKRVVVLGLLGASFVGVVGLWVSQVREPNGRREAETSDVKSVNFLLRCRSTLRDRYSFRYSSESRFSRQLIGAPSAASEERLDVSLQGEWSQLCASMSEDHRTLSVDFSKVQGHVRGSSPGFDSTETPGGLLAGIGFSNVTSHGEVKNIYFPKSMQLLGQHLLRDFLSLRSFRLPDRARVGESWSAAEKDLLGVYNARYRLLSAENGIAKVSKRRLGYVATKPGAQGMDAQFSGNNESMISIDLSSGMIRDIETTLTVTQLVDGMVVGENKTHLFLSHLGADELSPEELAMAQQDARSLQESGAEKWILSDTSASEVEERLERRLHEQQLAGRGWEEIRRQIEENDAFDTDTFLSAKALLVLQPKLASLFRDLMLSDKDPNGATFQLASGALAAAGTPQSQAAMLEGIHQLETSPTAKNILLGLVGQVNKPTGETVSFLEHMGQSEDLGDGVVNSSRLALGSVARQLDPAQRAPIVEGLLEKLNEARSVDQKVNALLSLGNTGENQLRPEFLTRLKDPLPLVRKASCFALGQQLQNGVAEPLIRTAQHDKDALVRVECLDALDKKALDPEQVDAVINVAMHDAVPDVRLAALRIAGAQESFPGLRSVLRHVRDEDSSPEVRRFAELVLLRLEASS